MTNRTSHARSGVLSALRRIVSGGSRLFACERTNGVNRRSGAGFQTLTVLGVAALTAATVLMPQGAQAQTDTWDGGGGDNNWGTGNNWADNSSPAPGTASDLFFAGSTRLSPFNNYTAFDDFRNITFSSGAGAFNITGNAIDLFGKIENLSTTAQTFALSLGVNTSFIEINPVSGNLNVNSANIFLGGNQLRVFGDSGNTLTFGTGTVISGTGGTVAINQNSTVVYQSAHTYTGGTFINAGTLRFNTGGSADSTALNLGDTSGTRAATLQVASGVTLGSGSSLTVRSGSSGSKSLSYTDGTGTGTVSRGITLNDNLTISAASGGTLTLSGVISGGSGFTNTGAGTIIFSGSSANTATGAGVIASGNTTIFNKSANTAAIAGAITVNSGATLRTDAVNQLNNQLVTVNGTFNLNNNWQQFALAGAGTVSLGSAALTNTNTGTDTFSGQITGTGSLTKAGSGILVLSGANNYSGGTLLSGGTIQIGNNSALGTGTITNLGDGAGLSTDGTARTIANNLFITNNMLIGGTGALQIDGTVTVGLSSTITNNNAGGLVLSNLTLGNSGVNRTLELRGTGNLTVNGIIANSASPNTGSLAISNSGVTTLNGNNSYSGTTRLGSGAFVIMGNANAFGATNVGTEIVSAGGTIDVNGQAVTGESLILRGTGAGSNGALRNSSGTAGSWSGSITLASTSYIGATNNSSLTVNAIDAAANELWIVGAGTTTIASGATNSGSGTAFVKTNTGTAILAASNAWSGNEFIREGTVVLSNNNALGTAGTTFVGATTGSAAATLRIGQGITNSNSITVEGGGTGTRTLAYAEGSGTGTQVGSLTLNTNSLAFNVASGGTIQFTGTVSTLGTARLSVDGGGTVISTGNSSTANSDNYQVRVGNGTLIIGGGTLIGRTNVAGLGHAIDLGVDLNNNIVNAASRLYASNGVTISNSIYVSTTNGQARVIGQRDMASSSTATYTGPVGLSSAALTIEAGTNSTVTLSGAVTNFAGTGNAVIKTGAGTAVLSGNNTHSGGTFLDSGALRLNNVNAGGTGSIVQSNGTSTLQIAAGGTITNNMSVYNVAFVNNGNTLSGRITNNNATYDVAAGTTNTLSGFVTGSGGLTKTGEGVLSVTGATNDYAGATTISNGTLRVTTLADAGAVSSIGTNATVNFSGTNASTTVLDYTGGNVTTDRSLVFNGVATNGEGGTLRVSNSSTVVTLDGSASGTGRMVVDGGTVVLSNTTTSNSFAPASIQVNSNSILQIAANEQIGNSTDLILNGGTLRLFNGATGYAETLGTLTLSASSTIDLGAATTLRNITFANSSAITWTGTLTITNWQGVANTTGDAGRLLFGSGGLTSGQMSQVYWAGPGFTGSGGTLIGPNGELVPIPEPRVYAAAIAILAAIGWRERRRILSLVKPKAQPGA